MPSLVFRFTDQLPPAHLDVWKMPRLEVLLDGRRLFCCDVLMSRLHAELTLQRVGLRADNPADAHLMHEALREYGSEIIEQAISEGTYPSEPTRQLFFVQVNPGWTHLVDLYLRRLVEARPA